ncbi:MAG: alpha/beta hydrolase [Elainellaceae cyanobacterium]
MPQIAVNSLNINYQILGDGEPLLLIMGFSFSLRDWGEELPKLLSKQYQVILFDNRDAGETDRVSEPYTLSDMANDAVGLLDALGIPVAHVFGVSMGGMIAQQIALNHPTRVKKLVLGCTMAGGICSDYSTSRGSLDGSSLELIFPLAFVQAHQTELLQFLQATVPYHSTGEALVRQLNAMNAHDICDRLKDITVPTLVITGDGDRAIPPSNSRTLADHIPKAELEIIPDAGHGFCFSHPELTAAIVTNFLQR